MDAESGRVSQRTFFESTYPCIVRSVFANREYRTPEPNHEKTNMNLKPQDILFLLKLVSIKEKPWTFNMLALELGMSPSEVHGSAQRCVAAKLAVNQDGAITPHARNLMEFLEHGIQFAFVPELGSISRGMPTAHAAPWFEKDFSSAELPPVWPDPDGKVSGVSFSPLYKSVPAAAKTDDALYELLAAVDCVRAGRAREKKWAIDRLKERILTDGSKAKSKH